MRRVPRPPTPSPEGEGEVLRIAGYAALFDVADGVKDTIRRGAFARTLALRQAQDRQEPLPLLWQHRGDRRIGTVESLAEDARGLRVVARIDRPGSRAAAALRAGEVRGMSFGYHARGFRRTAGGRVLEEIELLEISLVTHPMQPGARVHLVR
ncbi:MAG TPA: HK97 family phage prohead protease [Croceibacterium sp.]